MSPESTYSAAIAVSDPSGVGEVRRAAAHQAHALGFGETERENVAIVATEAASNVVKHASSGEIVIRPLVRDGAPGVEILALDKGPGMADVSRCLADGFSTGGSPGTGLGAISRLATTFEIHSTPGVGTALLARLWATRPGDDDLDVEAGAVCLPKHGEEVSGDAWSVAGDEQRVVVLVVDGLGHGPLAAAASRAAVKAFQEVFARAPGEILATLHDALRSTRGAAAAVAAIDLVARTVRYAGVGNIAGAVVTAETVKQMVSHNGTVGHDARKIQEFDYQFPAGARLVMHSDGLGTHWRIDKYAGLGQRHPSLVSAVLYRDFTRGRDDVTVVVLAERPRWAST